MLIYVGTKYDIILLKKFFIYEEVYQNEYYTQPDIIKRAPIRASK